MDGLHHKQSIHDLFLAWHHALMRLTGVVPISLCLVSQSWAQISTGAPQEAPKLTPLPHPEIAKPVMLEPGISTWIIVITVLTLLGLVILFLWLLFRKKSDTIPSSPPPLKHALERLERLRSQLEQLHPSEMAHQVSIILRDYQMGRYSLPAPYRTSEELYGVKSPVHREEIKQRFAPISAIYDRLEFDPIPATKADCIGLIEAAIQALHEEKRYQTPHIPITASSQSSLMKPTSS